MSTVHFQLRTYTADESSYTFEWISVMPVSEYVNDDGELLYGAYSELIDLYCLTMLQSLVADNIKDRSGNITHLWSDSATRFLPVTLDDNGVRVA